MTCASTFLNRYCRIGNNDYLCTVLVTSLVNLEEGGLYQEGSPSFFTKFALYSLKRKSCGFVRYWCTRKYTYILQDFLNLVRKIATAL